MIALKVENVTKKISGKTILDNVSFEINEGEIFGFIGPNGAGKSTMIKIISGLYKKNKGKIYIFNVDLDKEFEKATKQMGLIIETPDMYPNLTGMQNLRIFANMRGNVSNEKIKELVRLVKLEGRIHDTVKTYSLGMKQRLGLIQAMMHNPKLIILDEPTNGLDPIGILEFRELLKDFNQKHNTTIFISSHILSEVENICTKIAIIDNGKIVSIKGIEELKNEGMKILIEVDNIVVAKEIIEKKFNIKPLQKDNFLLLNINKDIFNNINKMLVENNINVYQIKIYEKTLEDEFIRTTKGSKDQIS